jgi:hypothetical protein
MAGDRYEEGLIMRTDRLHGDMDQPCPGTTVLAGAARARSDRDLAAAIAWTADGITAVDDCIDIEC